MKTQPLREDKHCLNCGTEVPERYCTHCGQENAVPHESFTHLVKHFIGDVLHYDSQFLTTLKYLLFRPGRLTKEYMAGKRVAYVNPIKLYIFISFVFFLMVALVTHGPGEEDHSNSEPKGKPHDNEDTVIVKGKSEDSISVLDVFSIVRDSLRNNLGEKGITAEMNRKDLDKLVLDSLKAKRKAGSPRTLGEYDSLQQALPADKKDGGTERFLTRRALHIQENYEDGEFWEAFKHYAPKLMFILLPLFALWMKLFYNWKRWYYTDHAIFALHVHCFAFVVLLITLSLDFYFSDSDGFTSYGILLILLYLWLALKHTYQQSYRRSFFKAILLLTGYSISLLFVFILFAVVVFAVIL